MFWIAVSPGCAPVGDCRSVYYQEDGLGGNEIGFNGKKSMSAPVIAASEEIHERSSVSALKTRLPRNIPFAGMVHSDHFVYNQPNAVKVVPRHALGAGHLVRSLFQHFAHQLVQVRIMLGLRPCHAAYANPFFQGTARKRQRTRLSASQFPEKSPAALVGRLGGCRSSAWAMLRCSASNRSPRVPV